jgi:hypothetical protein
MLIQNLLQLQNLTQACFNLCLHIPQNAHVWNSKRKFALSVSIYVPALFILFRLLEYFNRARATQSPRYHVDEQPTQCSDQEVRCRLSATLTCIHYEKLCDGRRDCPHGEDEQNCGFEIPQVPATTPR